MISNDQNIGALRHTIIEKVAELAWEGNLNEDTKEQLVYEMIPGPKPEWRCCIYKEREIVRHRIRLAAGQNLQEKPNSANQVQVIKPACDDCPIGAYSVTDNCRLCMGKACMNSCRFGAISIANHRSHIDPSMCKECGMCAQACPYGAIVHLQRPCKKACPVGAISFDEYGFCEIDESKCINCGQCIHNCPFGAISSKTYLVDIIEKIRSGAEVYAMAAPAIEGQYGEGISMASIREAVKKLGFKDLVEVGLGADMTAAYEAQEWSEARKEGRKMTTSCCPAFINMLKIYFPEQYKNNMSTVVSPMCAVSRYLKAIHPGCTTVFIGPCIAKKSEAAEPSIPDNADYVITFGEFQNLLDSRQIKLEQPGEGYQEATVFGKRFASSGGVASAVLEVMQERGEDTSEIKLCQAAGGAECKKALTLLKVGKLPEDFLEGMCCPGGCVGGPSRIRTENELKKARENILVKAKPGQILENLENYPMNKFSMYRDGHLD